MHIYIPTRGRFDKPIIPLTYLPEKWLKHTTVVVPLTELIEYNTLIRTMSLPELPNMTSFNYDGIADKRTKIGEYAERMGQSKFMMIDDDLNFLRRVGPDAVNQVTIRPDEKDQIDLMLTYVENYLDTYPQVALGMREGNNHAGVGPMPLPTFCTKAIRAVGYQTAVFRSVDTNRVRTMSDYDTGLQILEKGLQNVVLNYWMSGQKATNTAGGCSVWRTHEVHEESVKRMAELHPGICIPRWKENKGGGEFGKRMELMIQWKRAYEQGVRNAKT